MAKNNNNTPRQKWTEKKEKGNNSEQRWITYEPTCRTKTEKITPFVSPYDRGEQGTE